MPGQVDPGAGISAAAASATLATDRAPSSEGLARLLSRALHTRISPSDVQPTEVAALQLASVMDPHQQAFLAWRRSVLLLVAIAFIPLTILRLVEVVASKGLAGYLVALHFLPVLVEAGFCALMWTQLRTWTHWQRQRRALHLGWMVSFLAPFVVYLVPFDGATRELDPTQISRGLSATGGVALTTGFAAIGYSIQSLLVLAPKVLALMPGLIRAAILSKLLFPGSPAPGWTIVLASPIYALLIYILLLVPYQITGSGFFVATILGVIAAQVAVGRAGYRLARPSSHHDAIAVVTRLRTVAMISLTLAALLAVIALTRLTPFVELGTLTMVSALISFAANLLILTLIAADLVITSMLRARALSIDTQAAVLDSQGRLATFAGAPAAGHSERQGNEVSDHGASRSQS
jgi:hypothetical protein